jgi:hypothetical protein
VVELLAQVGLNLFVGLADFGAQTRHTGSDVAGVQVPFDVLLDLGTTANRSGIHDFGVEDFASLGRPLGPGTLGLLAARRLRSGLLRRLRSRRRPLGGRLLRLGNLLQQIFQFAHDAHDGRPPAAALVAIDLRISVSAWTFRSLK